MFKSEPKALKKSEQVCGNISNAFQSLFHLNFVKPKRAWKSLRKLAKLYHSFRFYHCHSTATRLRVRPDYPDLQIVSLLPLFLEYLSPSPAILLATHFFL